MNMFQFLGRLGADPEVKNSQQGLAITQVRIAVDKFKKVGDNEWDKETDWFSVDFIGRNAERIAARYKKGRQILVSGTVHPWSQEKDGETKRGYNFSGKMFWYVDEKVQSSDSQGGNANPMTGALEPGTSSAPAQQTSSIIEDEIPF